MAADANQLQDLHEFLLAGDEDSARRLTENLNPSSVVNVENVDFTKLPKDILGTSLIPVIDKPGHDGHRIAAQATGNGNCLYNSTSLSQVHLILKATRACEPLFLCHPGRRCRGLGRADVFIGGLSAVKSKEGKLNAARAVKE